MVHAAGRFILHFWAAPGIVLGATFALAFLVRKKKDWTWLPQTKRQIIAVAALAVFACATLREAYDVWAGQPLYKAFTDYSSWLLGCGVAVWALFRLETWK